MSSAKMTKKDHRARAEQLIEEVEQVLPEESSLMLRLKLAELHLMLATDVGWPIVPNVVGYR